MDNLNLSPQMGNSKKPFPWLVFAFAATALALIIILSILLFQRFNQKEETAKNSSSSTPLPTLVVDQDQKDLDQASREIDQSLSIFTDSEIPEFNP